MGKLRWTLAGLSLVACTESSRVEEVGASVGSEGGRVEAAGASVDVPPDALDEAVELGLGSAGSADLAALPGSVKRAGEAVAFTPYGQSFAVPVTLRIPAEPGASQVWRLDDLDDDSWERVSGPRFGGGVAEVAVRSSGVFAAVRAAGTGGGPASGGAVVDASGGSDPDSGPGGGGGERLDCDPECAPGEDCIYGVCSVTCEHGGGTGGTGVEGSFFCQSSYDPCSDGHAYSIHCENEQCECSVDDEVVGLTQGGCAYFAERCGFDVRAGEPALELPRHCPDAACAPGEACIDGQCAGGCLGGGDNGGTGGPEGSICFVRFDDCTDGASLGFECTDRGGCSCKRNGETVARPDVPQGCSAPAENIMHACGWDYIVVPRPGGGGSDTSGGTSGSSVTTTGVGTSGSSG